MTGADRAKLARILGMLGSEHAGERAAAAPLLAARQAVIQERLLKRYAASGGHDARGVIQL
jgi:hypothetical protein